MPCCALAHPVVWQQKQFPSLLSCCSPQWASGGGGFPRLGLWLFYLHRLCGTAQSSVIRTDLSPTSLCAVTCPCGLSPVWVCLCLDRGFLGQLQGNQFQNLFCSALLWSFLLLGAPGHGLSSLPAETILHPHQCQDRQVWALTPSSWPMSTCWSSHDVPHHLQHKTQTDLQERPHGSLDKEQLLQWDTRDVPGRGHCSGKHSLDMMIWGAVPCSRSAFALHHVGHPVSEGINSCY